MWTGCCGDPDMMVVGSMDTNNFKKNVSNLELYSNISAKREYKVSDEGRATLHKLFYKKKL